MNDNAQSVISLVQDWLFEGQRLQTLLEKQTDALICRDSTMVQNLSTQIEALMLSMTKLDQKRDECSQKISLQLGCENKISVISKKLAINESRALDVAGARAKRLGEKLSQLLAKNKALMENELVYIDGTLGLIQQAITDTTMITPGQVSPVWIDQRI